MGSSIPHRNQKSHLEGCFYTHNVVIPTLLPGHHFSWLHLPLLSWRSESLPCSRGKPIGVSWDAEGTQTAGRTREPQVQSSLWSYFGLKPESLLLRGSGFSISSTQKSPPQSPSHRWSYVICWGSFGKGTRVKPC